MIPKINTYRVWANKETKDGIDPLYGDEIRKVDLVDEKATMRKMRGEAKIQGVFGMFSSFMIGYEKEYFSTDETEKADAEKQALVIADMLKTAGNVLCASMGRETPDALKVSSSK